MFLGLRTIIYAAPNLEEAKEWYSKTLGIKPYFDEEFYVGFNIAGYELALDPHANASKGPVTYWGVANADEAYKKLLADGAKEHQSVREVGDSIRTATVIDASGNLLGIIENPHFMLAEPTNSSGPGK